MKNGIVMRIKDLNKGNIIIVTLLISLIFSITTMGIYVYSITHQRSITTLTKELERDRNEENLAYELFLTNGNSVYEYHIDGYYITIDFTEGPKKYFIDGVNGLICIRKVSLNE